MTRRDVLTSAPRTRLDGPLPRPPFARRERWRRDPDDPDLWFGPGGVAVNGAALREREAFYRVERR